MDVEKAAEGLKEELLMLLNLVHKLQELKVDGLLNH